MGIQTAINNQCQPDLNPVPLPRPLPLHLPSGYFFPLSASSTPMFLFCIASIIKRDKSDPKQVAFPSSATKEPRRLCWEVWASGLLLAFLPTLGLSLLLRPSIYGHRCYHAAFFLGTRHGFLLPQSLLHCFLPDAILSWLHCSSSASSMVPICPLALCISH